MENSENCFYRFFINFNYSAIAFIVKHVSLCYNTSLEGAAVMDIFIEHLVKQKTTAKTNVLKALIIIGTILLEIILALLLLIARPLAFFIFLFMAGAIYGAWFLMRLFKIEFEYIVVSNVMSVDKIIAQSKRKRLVSIDFKNMEIMAPMRGNHKREFENPSIPKTIDVSVSPTEEGAYFIVARTEKLGLLRIIFTPDERIIKSAQTMAPRKVFTD